MITTGQFIQLFPAIFKKQEALLPWEITSGLTGILSDMIAELNSDYNIVDGTAIHKTAIVESGAIIKAPVLIGAHCFVGSNAYLRGGVYLAEHARIGTGCEVKTSIIFNNSAIAHFNFIGDSIIGSYVNFEAGAITANHYNERTDKGISVLFNSSRIHTGVFKFGALVGDHSKIGANAVLSPGTILSPGSIVKRLELVDQAAISGR